MNIEIESLLSVFEDTKIIFKHPPRPLDLSRFDNKTPVYCQPDVLKAMKKAWSQSANGTSGVEAGFRLDGTPRSYKIVPNAFTNQQKKQTLTMNVRFNICDFPRSSKQQHKISVHSEK